MKGSVLLQDIQTELFGRTTHIVSKRWLTRLLAFHHIDTQSSDELIAASLYYKSGRWDLSVPGTAEWDAALCVDDQNTSQRPNTAPLLWLSERSQKPNDNLIRIVMRPMTQMKLSQKWRPVQGMCFIGSLCFY